LTAVVIRCAAEEPLVEDIGSIRFDMERFQDRLLGLATTAGRA
jgi:hypothetical protein